jgi:hypothetical protein
VKNSDDLSTWWYWELAKEDRRWGKYAMPADEEIRFEMERRRENWKLWGLCIGISGAIIAAIFFLHSN